MKILYLHQYFNTPQMSGGTRSFEMAKRLVSDGHEVHVITSDRNTKEKKKEWYNTKVNGINVHWYPVEYSNNLSFFKRIFAFIKFALFAIKKSTSLNCDIIFATSTPLTIAIPAVFAKRKLGVPMVFEVRDLWPELPIAMGVIKSPVLKFLAKKLELWAYKNSDSFIALSPGMKAGIMQQGVDESRIAVIPNSCDNNEFKPDKVDKLVSNKSFNRFKNKPLLVYVGTFGAINGVEYMTHLAKHLDVIGSELNILLVGSGSEWDLVKNKAIELGVLNKNLFIEKSIPKNEVPSLLAIATAGASLFIDLPEMRTNSANKFFDTLAANKPVVINYAGWMKSLVKDYKCGICLHDMDFVNAAKLLNKNLTDEYWLKSAQNSSSELSKLHFDRDILARQFGKVIEDTLNSKDNSISIIAPGKY